MKHRRLEQCQIQKYPCTILLVSSLNIEAASQILTITDLKNTTDDALPNYLASLKFKQSHILTDVRLLLGYTAVLTAAITFYFDYKLGWDQTKDWTLWAVVVYFLLNGALTLWIWKAEKGNVFVGRYNNTMVKYIFHNDKLLASYI